MINEFKEPVYLFLGFGTEYVLTPLAEYMKAKGYSIVELDMMEIANAKEILRTLKGKKIVFITCGHLFFDAYNLSHFSSTTHEIVSPLEVMEYLNPIRNIYYPHDLGTYFLPEELPWIDLFDVILLPFKNSEFYLLERYTQVCEVGWIKKNKQAYRQPAEEQNVRLIHFPSGFIYFIKNYSPDEIYAIWQPLWECGITIKFPRWPGLDAIADKCRSQGHIVIDENLKLFDVIEEADIIIATGSSSVLYEAGLSGWPVISVKHTGISPAAYDKNLPRYPWLRCLYIDECVPFIKQLKAGQVQIPTGLDILPPFKFEMAEKIIIDT